MTTTARINFQTRIADLMREILASGNTSLNINHRCYTTVYKGNSNKEENTMKDIAYHFAAIISNLDDLTPAEQ